MKNYCHAPPECPRTSNIICNTAKPLSVSGLECYVCKDQEDNNEKCVKTIKTCDYNQDVCLTEIKWGSTPYWSQGAKKQYYVSKRCSNKTECATTRQRNMPLCTHIWYLDWVCSDCCQGDRCNYYIIVSLTWEKKTTF